VQIAQPRDDDGSWGARSCWLISCPAYDLLCVAAVPLFSTGRVTEAPEIGIGGFLFGVRCLSEIFSNPAQSSSQVIPADPTLVAEVGRTTI
jgi:hypothetical protein